MKTTQLLFRALLLWLLAIGSIGAQTISTDYATQINATFANLDKTKVPHKLLIDYAMEFAELSAYNGTLTSDNILHRGHYTAIYNTLLMARVQNNVTGLVNPTTFRTNWESLRQSNKIVLSGLYYKYNQFKPNASPNLVTITNNKLYDKYVNGVWQNPYDEKQVFAIAAPILKYNDLSMQVQLPSSLWYTNQSSSVQSIAIDFSDGLGYQTVTLGQLKTVTYSQSGLYEWKYRLTLTNNQILYSHSKIQIEGTTTNPVVLRTINQPCTNPFGIDLVDFVGTRTYLSQVGTAKLQIDYALNDCTIRKPLIVVEGFDSGLLGVENPLGEANYFTFINQATINSSNLPTQLSSYDIIYVNWNNGKDYLQRNAYLLQDIIKWVNIQKANAGSNTPNVVLGQSMGGVIARYALRDMEVQQASTGIASWNHQTSLYISHDAPHQGANIPLSIQYFARHLVDQFVSTPLGDMNINPNDGAPITIEDIQTLFNANGTKQLLTEYINSSFTRDNIAGNTFRTELKNLGYPQQTRNIAISNGNHCANQQEYNPSDILFSLSGSGKTTFLTSFLTVLINPLNVANAIAFSSLAFLYNEPGLLLGILPGNSKFNMNFTAKALPYVGNNIEIYRGTLSFTKKLFWLFNITVNLTNRGYNNPSGILSYDYYPGGKYPVPFDFQNTSVNNAFIAFGISAQIKDSFNFIPTPSALDIGKSNITLNDSDFFQKYSSQTPPVAPKDSPFVNFTTSYTQGSSLNEAHISFNTKNGNWLATELDNITNNNQIFDCRYICSGASISGPSSFCTNATYNGPTNTAVTFYSWLISEGSDLVTITNNSPSSITLNTTNNGSGFVTITLVYGDNNARCGNKTISKRVHIGGPSLIDFTCNIQGKDFCSGVVYASNSELPSLNLNDEITVNFNTVTPATTINSDWEWQPLNNLIQLHGNNNKNKRYITILNYGQTGVKVRTRNTCGWSNWVELPFEIIQIPDPLKMGNQDSKLYKIYPNPSDTILNIELKDKNENNKNFITATLYNFKGEIERNITIENNLAILNVIGLKKGIYLLKININGIYETHQVGIK